MKYSYILPLSILLSAGAQAELGHAGFGGEVGVMAGFGGGKSNFNLDNATKKGALNSAGESESQALFIPTGKLNYTFGEQNSQQLYFGMPDNDLVGEAVALEFGYKIEFANESLLTLAYVPTLSKGETWQDPYLTNTKRKKTDVSGNTYSISYENMFDTGLTGAFSVYDKDIDNDQAGNSATSLKRSGDGYLASLAMGLPISDIEFIEPELSYHHFSADGKAMSFDEYVLAFSYMVMLGKESLAASAGYSSKQFDANNPLFNKTQEDSNYSLQLMYEYNEFMGWQDWKLNALIGYSTTASNIAFYDTSDYMTGVGITYTF